MDAALLTTRGFWDDPAPFAVRAVPPLPELSGHVLFETSGSTGAPKWVALSKQALLVSAAAVNEHLGVTPESRWGLALPVHHVGGFGVTARAYQAGCGFRQFNGRWDAASFSGWLAREGVTHTSLVPAQVHDLVAAGLTGPSCLAAVVVGGGRLEERLGQAARDAGWPVLASFGMTEAGSQIATQAPVDLALPYRSAPIPLLPIWQAEISPDGLLAIAGPALFSGCLVDGKFQPRTSPWHVTSDRAELTASGIVPLGRADSRVKILGELVDPESVERELEELAGGKLSAGSFIVVAIPDERSENVLVPVFEAAADVGVLAAYASGAPGFRKLQPPVVLAEFPRSALGKPRRAEIHRAVLTARSAPPA